MSTRSHSLVKRFDGIYTGPYFDSNTPTNITAQLGGHAYLPCKVRQLGNKSVSPPLYLTHRFQTYSEKISTLPKFYAFFKLKLPEYNIPRILHETQQGKEFLGNYIKKCLSEVPKSSLIFPKLGTFLASKQNTSELLKFCNFAKFFTHVKVWPLNWTRGMRRWHLAS